MISPKPLASTQPTQTRRWRAATEASSNVAGRFMPLRPATHQFQFGSRRYKASLFAERDDAQPKGGMTAGSRSSSERGAEANQPFANAAGKGVANHPHHRHALPAFLLVAL